MVAGRTIRSILEGGIVPNTFIYRLIARCKQGQLPFDKLVKFHAFGQINQAAEDSEKRITLKPVLGIGKV